MSTLKNRSKVIDEAVEGPKSSPSVTIQIHSGQSLGELPKAAKNRKYDSYLQKYVNEEDWKSPQQHAEEEDAKKAKE